jgi:hypothetical protein
MKDIEQCYMCEAQATSREHVPPKCIFPQRKDLGVNLRRDLITIPACEVHNLRNSKDDEFLLICLAGVVGNNSIGYRHNQTKVSRALRRSAGRLLDTMFTSRRHVRLGTGENKFFDVIIGTPHYGRLERCFDRVGRGLYYCTFSARFNGCTRLVMGHVHRPKGNAATFTDFIRHRAEIDLRDVPRVGQNPEVFFHQFAKPDEFGLIMLRMCFYGGVDIYISFIPEGVKIPGNLTMELIDRGIETHFRLEGKDYRFN